MPKRIVAFAFAALVLTVSACASEDATATSMVPTTRPATVSTTPPTSTTLPSPPDERNVDALAWGLFCRDLNAARWNYDEVVAYWNAEGRPARMDEDENGIPCETVYPASDLIAFWGDPLPTGLAPGSGSGWHASQRQAQVASACCSMNHNGPESPQLPAESGGFPDDGAFSVEVTREQGRTDRLELEVRRWLPCSEQPDQCSPDLFPGDVYPDPADAVVKTMSLDAELIVVIRPIGHFVDDIWTELPPIEGDGAALGVLLRRLDAATVTVAAPARRAGIDLEAVGVADPTFPYGLSKGGAFLAYRGPENSYLTAGFYDAFERDEPSGMYGWWCTLEILDGTPILYVWAGQIAG